MSSYDFANDDFDPDEAHREMAAGTDRTDDPLAEHEAELREKPDPFRTFVHARVMPEDPAENTLNGYSVAYKHWAAHMAEEGRHPACANHWHVKRFADYLRDEHDNNNDTIKQKLRRIERAYDYMREYDVYPHPAEYKPVALGREELNLASPERDDYPNLTEAEMAVGVERITHIRDRAIIILQTKLAMRAGAVCNAKLEDINLKGGPIEEHYPSLGTHPEVVDKPQAIVIPSRYERNGNKSWKSRVLPLDQETRRWLRAWLMIRPENDEGWVFLSDRTHQQLDRHWPNNIWREAFPHLVGLDDQMDIRSHFGRHFFSYWWDTEKDLKDTKIKWMRGDKFANENGRKEALDHYRQVTYDDIEDLYRREIFRFGV